MAYAFDTNTILEAKNRYYGFDFCPAFWDWLVLERERGNVLSTESVRAELQDPDAKAWANSNKSFFDVGDDRFVGEVAEWVTSQSRFTPAAKQQFLGSADPRLISFAKAKGHVLVTREVSAPDSSKSIKIPDVCKALGVPVCNTFEVLTELQARFVLEAGS